MFWLKNVSKQLKQRHIYNKRNCILGLGDMLSKQRKIQQKKYIQISTNVQF